MKQEYVTLYDRMVGRKDEDYAVALVSHERELARQGYAVDRIEPVKTSRHGPYWKYEVPVIRVTH